MPLPIPDIMQNAGNALIAAKKVVDTLAKSASQPEGTQELIEALKKVSPDDLLAVLNEIGQVYHGVHNINVTQIGSRPNPKAKTLEIALQINAGLGPKMVMMGLPFDSAEALVKAMSNDLQAIKPSGLITNV